MEMDKEALEKTLREANIATNFDALANLYRTQGKYAEAERLHKQAREMREKSSGSENS